MLARGGRILARGGPGGLMFEGVRDWSSVVPEFTEIRYPHVKRGPYAHLTDRHLGFFKDLLGPTRVVTDENECEGFNVDWIKNVRGRSRCVLKPRTTEEVSKILAFCDGERVAVCPQGGNTGLVGGSVPVFDEIVLSTALMDEIIGLDENSGVLVCQAGCVLERLERHVEARGLTVPLDLGAKGSCHIGGNVSTNAGGLRLLRYGNLHGNVLGLEAVKADGTVVDCLSTLKKDNTGYHLKHLFIGSEGTLGVVTKVAIQCPAKAEAVNVAFLGVNTFADALKTAKRAKRRLGEILSACELVDAASLDLVGRHLNLKSPLGAAYPFHLLVETRGGDGRHDAQKMHEFLDGATAEGVVRDGAVTDAPSKINAIWALRERITEACVRDGYVFKYDISLPTEHFYSLVPVMRERMGASAIRVFGYGHLGDGNIHVQVTVKEFTEEILKKIEPFVYEYTAKLRGSISAEHGVGFRKPEYVKYSKSAQAIALMRQLKGMMDPNGILNPYKVLPQ